MNGTPKYDVKTSAVTRTFGTDPRLTNSKPTEMHTNASLFFRDAETLGDLASAGPFVLLMHALELALKSFLHHKGYELKKLGKKPFGHHLVNLLKEARASGLVVSDPDTDDIIARLNQYAYRARIRYDFSFTMPLVGDVLRVTRSVLDNAEPRQPPID